MVTAGRTGVESFWARAVTQASELRLTAKDVTPLGSEAAREIGTFALTTKGQQPQEIAGKYVVIWQKAGGEWKIATDIWNTNK
jgi:ketosteroid isomerase-like protein